MAMAARKPYSLPTLLSVSGFGASIFRDRQKKNRLFADLGQDEEYAKADIAAARMVHLLTGLGIDAQSSVDSAMKALPIFEKLFTDEAFDTSLTNIIAIYPTGRSEHFAYPRLANESAADGACVIVDAFTIAEYVRHELLELKPPIVTSADELGKLANKTVADAWKPVADADGLLAAPMNVPAPIGAPSRAGAKAISAELAQ
jgi:hypothetical protein